MADDSPQQWCEGIVEQAGEAIIAIDRNGIVRLWNRGAEALLGHAAADICGRIVDIVIPERLRAAHWQGFRRAIDAGEVRNAKRVLTTRAVHKDGSARYIDFSFGLLHDAAGAVCGAFAIGREGAARRASGPAADQAHES